MIAQWGVNIVAGGGKSVLSYFRLLHVPRPVLMQIAEVLNPHHSLIDITRCDLWTLISVQPGTDTHQGVLEMASKLYPFEAEGWGRPWVEQDADLTALLQDPIRTLNLADPRVLRKPAVPAVIPPAMWVPGRDYTHTS